MLSPEAIEIARQGAALCRRMDQANEAAGPVTEEMPGLETKRLRAQDFADAMVDACPQLSPSAVADELESLAATGHTPHDGLLAFAALVRQR